MATAELVAVGSELLLGQIVDTNSAWMAERLTGIGVDLFYKTVVGDNPARMKEAVTRALERADIVITGGGLGPTQDDLTREVIADVTGRRLVIDPGLMEEIELRFRRRGMIMTRNNEKQAQIPEGAVAVRNPNGTAPSFVVEDSRGVVFALPGVPHELKWLFDNEVVPYLRNRFRLESIISSKVLKVVDLGESAVDDRIGHLISGSINPTLGVLAHPGQVDVRITAKAGSSEEAAKMIRPLEDEVRDLLGIHVFAIDERSMEEVVGELLLIKKKTIAVYEDLTSGLLSERLMNASNDHFLEGVVCNSEISMERLLAFAQLPGHTEATASAPDTLTDSLAWCVRHRAEADYGLAVHGVPDEGDKAHNLAQGATYFSITDGSEFRTRMYNFAGRGLPDRTRATLNALALVRLTLIQGIC